MVHWLGRQAGWLYPLYACALFLAAALILTGAALRGEFSSHWAPDVGVAALMYVFAIFIILLGFAAPRFTHVSLDRITQLGLIWVFGPAAAALLNGLASLSYPLLKARRNHQTYWQALINGAHNAGMFAIAIYLSGSLYVYLGGAVPLTTLSPADLLRVVAVYLSMQLFNEVLMTVKAAIALGKRRKFMDLFSATIELAATAIALLLALIYNNTSATVTGLFMVFLIAVIYISKYLNKVATALSRRVKQVVTLNSMAKAISSSLVLEDLTQVIYKECHRLLGFTEFYLGFYNEQSGVMEYKLIQQSGNQLSTTSSGVKHGLIEWVLRHQRPLHLPSYHESGPEFLQALGARGPVAGSFVGIPINFKNETLGIISLQSDTDDAFSRSDFKLIQAMARQASVAIKNASLFQKLEDRKEELERKVLARTAQIEVQKEALAEMNRSLGSANQRQEELLAALQKTSAELERQSMEDPLTGLHNRRYLEEYMRRELDRARRKGGTLTTALVDLDHFKLVNDNFSHSVGDLTLQAVAKLLRDGVRTVDLVARFGGEELFVCMPDTPLPEASMVCERLRVAIQEFDWNSIAPTLAVTASFGVAQATDDYSLDDLVRRSDDRLYHAKRSGRNCVSN